MIQLRVALKANKIPLVQQRLPERIHQVVRKTALDLVAHAQTEMAKPKSGRVYKRGKGRFHVASAPGEAPAIDTGTLAGSFRIKRLSQTSYLVSVGAEHAAYMEYGTRYIAPRPFLEPTAQKLWPEFKRAMTEAVRGIG